MNIFIQDINLEFHQDINEFLFGETYSILNKNIQEIIEKIGVQKFRQIWRDSTPSFIETIDIANDLRYSNENRNLLLPKVY